MSGAAVYAVQLKRQENTQPWGFRLKGGSQQGMPLIIEQCAPNGRAGQAGLEPGDFILAICNVQATSMSHDQAKSEILRAGNDLDLTIQRGTPTGGAGGPVPVQQLQPAQSQAQEPAQPRVQVVEEPQARLGGPTYKEVQTKTMAHLEKELPAAETGALPPGYTSAPPPGARPASIFDRKKKERSDYLHAKGPTIQKAFGQQK